MEQYIGMSILALCLTPVVTIVCAFSYNIVFGKFKLGATHKKGE